MSDPLSTICYDHDTDLIHPHIGGHHLVLQVYIDQLRQLQSQPHCQRLCEVRDWSDETIVVVEQVIIETLGVGIAEDT